MDYRVWLKDVESLLRSRRPDLRMSDLDPNAMHAAFSTGVAPIEFVAQPSIPLRPVQVAAPAPQVQMAAPPQQFATPQPVYLVAPSQGSIQLHPGTNSPVVAAMLGVCCLVGLGQMYNKQPLKGVVILLSSIVLAVVTMGLSALITWPVQAIDAFMIGKKLQEGRAIGPWEWF